jgi:outer membrane receptor protein involved in Fe transport
VILDGVELYEPYHLKDFQSVFSIIDAEAVGGVDFLTGGFPAEYGDRMSGVMDISMVTPSGPTSTTVAVSTLNTRLLSAGRFNDDRGSWLVSGRAWYPDALLEPAGATAEEILTDYYDLVAKVEHRVGSRSTLSANLMSAYDDLGFLAEDEEEVERVRARYRSHQLWFNLRTDWNQRVFSQTVLAGGRIRRERLGGVVDIEEGTLSVDDQRSFDFIGLRQDWTVELSDRHLLKFGFDVKRQQAVYDYVSEAVVIDPEVVDEGPPIVTDIEVDLEPAGESYGFYVADRFRPAEPLVVEIGLRWDKQFWIDDKQVSPRVNLMYNAGPRTTVRAAWGRFHQTERLNELQVEDGVTEFSPAQLAEHWLVSLEHGFARGPAFRVEAYYKDLFDLRPRYENLFNPLELFPESREDRVLVAPDRGRAQGVEILLKGSGGRLLTWWASYALARAEDEIDGSWQPRSWDQRHAATFGLNLDLPRGWNISLAGTYHSGFPTTDVTAGLVEDEEGELDVESELGPRNGGRFSSYRRLDLRTTKRLATRKGELTLILEVINLFNRKNACCVDDFLFEVEDDGSVTVIREEGYWAPIIPSLGLRWRF